MDQRIIAIKNKILAMGKKGNWLWILGLVGILLIGLSTMFSSSHTESSKDAVPSCDDTTLYAKELEERLEKLVGTIGGVGECEVMVTMEQGTEYIYATQQKNTVDASQTSENSRYSEGSRSSDEETYIMVSTDKGEQPVLLTALSPRVKGVVVVCQGGEEAVVCEQVKTAIATVLNINSNRICVVAGNFR